MKAYSFNLGKHTTFASSPTVASAPVTTALLSRNLATSAWHMEQFGQETCIINKNKQA